MAIVRLARAHPNHGWIRWCHGDVTDRADRLIVEKRFPGDPVVRSLPHSGRGGAGEDDRGVHGHEDQPDLRLSCKEMYKVFQWWRSQNIDINENKIPTMKTINKEIRDRGHKVDRVGGVTYIFAHSINLEVVTAVQNYSAGDH